MGKNKRVVEWQSLREVDSSQANRLLADKHDHYVSEKLAEQHTRSDAEQDLLDELSGFDYRTILEKGEAEILKMYVNEGKSPKEIGMKYNIKPMEVGKIIQRIGRKIKKHLEVK